MEMTVTILFFALAGFVAGGFLVLTRHVSWAPSWESWKPDDWIAFVFGIVVVVFVLNMVRILVIRDVLMRMEQDRPVFGRTRKPKSEE